MRFGRRRRESEFDRGYRDGLERGRPDPGMSIGEPYEEGFAAGAHTFERLAERARHLLEERPAEKGPDRPRRVLIVEAPGDEFAVGEAFKLGDVVQGSMSQVADADEVFVFRGDKAIAAKHRDREPEDVTVSIQRQIRPRPAAADEPENPTEFTRQVLESAKALVMAATFELLARDRGRGPVNRVQVEEAIERAFVGVDPLPMLDRIDAAYRRHPVVRPGEVVIRLPIEQAEALVDPVLLPVRTDPAWEEQREKYREQGERRDAALVQISHAVESAR